MTEIALIGVGQIGAQIGRHLVAAGHHVRGWDVNCEAIARATQFGVAPTSSLPEVCVGAELIITCLTDGSALFDVALGEGGLPTSAAAGSTVIDTTSAEPWISADIGARLAERGVGFLDAPVSGGVPAAKAARMNFMVGGDPELLERWRHVLHSLGQPIAHVGPVGAGHAVKALNMLSLGGNMLVTLEAIAVGLAGGLPAPGVVDELIQQRAGSYVCRLHLPRFIFPGSYDSGFTFDLMLKDLTIGIEFMRRSGLAAPMAEMLWTRYRSLATQLSGQDNTKIAQSYFEPVLSAGRQTGGRSRLGDGLVAMVRLAQMGIADEIVAAARLAGLDLRLVLEVLRSGSGESDHLTDRLNTAACYCPATIAQMRRAAGSVLMSPHQVVPTYLTNVALAAACSWSKDGADALPVAAF